METAVFHILLVLFDPGCYYGHSEVDFIIPALEENFPPEFFDAYFKVML